MKSIDQPFDGYIEVTRPARRQKPEMNGLEAEGYPLTTSMLR